MSLDKKYQVDILYEFAETLKMHTLHAIDYETIIEDTENFLEDMKEYEPYVLNARMYIGDEKILIKQKVIELINRRKNGKQRME